MGQSAEPSLEPDRGSIRAFRAIPCPAAPAGSLLLFDILAETERRVIRQALEQEKWNRTKAAQALGISRRQLFDKIRQYGLQE